MKLFVNVGTAICFAAALSYGANINGKLVDASCYNNSQNTQASTEKSHGKLESTCAPTSATTAFAVITSGGKVYNLDASGNTKAEAAMKNGSLKSDEDGDVHVSIAGTTQGNSVKVDSVSGTKSHDEDHSR